jgi:protein TonB
MALRLWAPPRPQPFPFAGAALSLTAHVVVLAAVGTADGTGGSGTGARVRAGGYARDGERVHWVGLTPGGSGAALPRTTAERQLPFAYVVPGRGPARMVAPGAVPRRADAPAGARAKGAPPERGRTIGDLPRLSSTPQRAAARRRNLPIVPLAPTIDTDAMLLVAGVVSVAPDLTRRVTRAEDFVPAPEMSDERPGTVAHALALARSDVRVDELPVPMVTNPPPLYPLSLQQARVGGEVVVEFMIDSTGVVQLATLRVVESTNELFAQAVERVLPRLRFLPAHLGERNVGVLVRQPFVFTTRRVR